MATPRAFLKILEQFEPGTQILDIGVGSATYLEYEPVRKLLRERQLFVYGVDISRPNVEIAHERIVKHKLEEHFAVKTQDCLTLDTSTKYDAILFMESFPCMSVDIFTKIFKFAHKELRKPQGRSYLYHNLADDRRTTPLRLALGRVIKPCLKHLVGVDFGRLTTVDEMAAYTKAAVPGAEFSDVLLLSCQPNEFKCDFKGVSSWWHALWGHVFVLGGKATSDPIEQHLVTVGPVASKKTK